MSKAQERDMKVREATQSAEDKAIRDRMWSGTEVPGDPYCPVCLDDLEERDCHCMYMDGDKTLEKVCFHSDDPAYAPFAKMDAEVRAKNLAESLRI